MVWEDEKTIIMGKKFNVKADNKDRGKCCYKPRQKQTTKTETFVFTINKVKMEENSEDKSRCH